MNQEVTEDNFVQQVKDFSEWKYSKDISKSLNSCPYDLDFDDEDHIAKQIFTWFVYDRINPKTGITILEEFVEHFVKDEILASKILKVKDLFFDEFKILQSKGDVVVVKSKRREKIYTVQLMCPPQIFLNDRSFLGRIHPWHKNGTYRTCGILKIMKSDKEILQNHGFITGDIANMIQEKFMQEFQDNKESIYITQRSKISPSLKKYPIEWINQMCKSLHLDSKNLKKKQKAELISSVLTSKLLCDIVKDLSEDEKIGLEFIMKKMGTVKYSDIQKRLGKDDTKINWEKTTVQSTIGLLRRKALLLVGVQRIKTRNYKVVMIASDVLVTLRNYDCLGPK